MPAGTPGDWMATTSPYPLRAVLGATHPTYDRYRPVWDQLAHVAEGAGGFLDGTYLVAHPREWIDHTSATPRQPTKKLLERRRLARYENLAGWILAQKLSGLFAEPPVRRFGTPAGAVVEDHPYLTWTADVDGAGTSLTDWLRGAFYRAMTLGHGILVMDRATDDGQTAADVSPLRLREYIPQDMPDWLQDPTTGALRAVKLVEPAPRTSLADPPIVMQSLTVHEITETEAVTYTVTAAARRSAAPTSTRDTAESIPHGFGTLPVVLLYAHRRAFTPLIGQSALGDPTLYIDLFNLTSELRELLRKQTFSLLNIPLGVKADGSGPSLSVQAAQEMMGQMTGTENVLFSGLAAAYISPDTANVTAYQLERENLIREICRQTAVPFEEGGRQAESAEARRMKRSDYVACLQGYADELTQAEIALAQLWFRGTYGERWRQEWERVTYTVNYPQSFGEQSMDELLGEAQAAAALPLGESRTFRVELSDALVKKFLPNAPQATIDTIRAEIEALPTPEEQRERRLQEMASRFAAPRALPPASTDTPDDEADEAAE